MPDMIPKSKLPQLEQLLVQMEKLDLASLPEVQERARLLLLDTLACTAAGLTKPEPADLANKLGQISPGKFSWPGSSARAVRPP